MVPIPKSVNSAMFSGHEGDMHQMLGKKPKPPIWFQADVTYWGNGAIRKPQEFGKSIKVQLGEAKMGKSGKWVKGAGKSPITYDVPLPEKASGRDLVGPEF